MKPAGRPLVLRAARSRCDPTTSASSRCSTPLLLPSACASRRHKRGGRPSSDATPQRCELHRNDKEVRCRVAQPQGGRRAIKARARGDGAWTLTKGPPTLAQVSKPKRFGLEPKSLRGAKQVRFAFCRAFPSAGLGLACFIGGSLNSTATNCNSCTIICTRTAILVRSMTLCVMPEPATRRLSPTPSTPSRYPRCLAGAAGDARPLNGRMLSMWDYERSRCRGGRHAAKQPPQGSTLLPNPIRA